MQPIILTPEQKVIESQILAKTTQIGMKNFTDVFVGAIGTADFVLNPEEISLNMSEEDKKAFDEVYYPALNEFHLKIFRQLMPKMKESCVAKTVAVMVGKDIPERVLQYIVEDDTFAPVE